VRFARFVAVGAANTAASYAAYLLLLLFLDYRIAYTVAFFAVLALGYWAHATFVFRARFAGGDRRSFALPTMRRCT
jgi:putative flippase GtrA